MSDWSMSVSDWCITGVRLVYNGVKLVKLVDVGVCILPFDYKYVIIRHSGTRPTLYPFPHGPAQPCRNVHEQYTLVDSRFTVRNI